MATRTPRIGGVNALERTIIVVSAVLVVVGVVAVASAAAPQAAANGSSIWMFMVRDLAYVALGAVAFVITCRFPMARLSTLVLPALIATGALLVAVHLIGTSASGGQRWLAFGSFSFQPSEAFTLAACCYLAVVIARAERSRREWKDILLVTLPVLAGAALILLEPDMGTASVVVLITLGVLVLAGMPGRLTAAVCALLAFASLIFAYAQPYRRARLLAFLHPGRDSSGAGYQLLQAKIGIGAGRITGLGYGQSREKWGLLPNPHTDFIFAIIGEELGFIGATLVIALFAWLILLGLRTASRASDREGQLLAGAITLWFAVEVVINVASVLGWWPVTGIPLPFVSYGGTSLIIDLAAMGLLANVARRSTLARRGARPVMNLPVAAPAERRAEVAPRRRSR